MHITLLRLYHQYFKPLLLVAIPILAYWPVSFLQYTLKWDVLNDGLADRYFISTALQNGYIPFWNPYMKMGTPLYADPGGNFFSPIVWMIGWGWGYDAAAINLEWMLYMIAAATGMFLLLRSLGIHRGISMMIAVVYPMTGFFIGNAQNISCIASAAWLPFIFNYFYRLSYSYDWLDGLKCGCFSTLLVVTGYPGFVIMMSYLLGGASLVLLSNLYRKGRSQQFRQRLKCYLVTAGTALIMSAGYIYAITSTMPLMTRGESLTVEWMNFNSFSPQSVISLLLPFTTLQQDDFFATDLTMRNAYFGLFPLLLLGSTLITLGYKKYRPRFAWFYGFLGLGLFGVFVALGDYLHFRTLLYYVFPLMGLFKHPSLFRVFAILGFLIVVSYSVHRAYFNRSYCRLLMKYSQWLGYGIFVLLGGVVIVSLLKVEGLTIPPFHDLRQFSSFSKSVSIYESVVYQGLIQLLLLTLLIAGMYKVRRKGFEKKYLILAGVVVVVDLFLAARLNMTGTVISGYNVSELDQKLRTKPAGFPIPRLTPIKENTHYSKKELLPIWYNTNIYRKRVSFDAYNKFELKNFHQFRKSVLPPKTLQNPLLFLTDDIRPIEALKSEKSRDTIKPKTIFTTSDLAVSPCADTGSHLKITHFSPRSIKVIVQTRCKQALTLLQNHFPEWQVKVDGKTVTPIISNYTFLTVAVPKGTHNVEFTYHPPVTPVLGSISAFAFLLVSFLILGESVRRRFKGNRVEK